MKKFDKILTHFGDATYQKYIFWVARGVQLDNGVNPPPVVVEVSHLVFMLDNVFGYLV